MKEFKGTKGEWRIEEGTEPIEVVLIEKGWQIGTVVVAYMGQEDEAGMANAHLIAAAPDLLAACQKSLDTLTQVKKLYKGIFTDAAYSAISHRINDLTAAISKALPND